MTWSHKKTDYATRARIVGLITTLHKLGLAEFTEDVPIFMEDYPQLLWSV